jgi:hypothetical protein
VAGSNKTIRIIERQIMLKCPVVLSQGMCDGDGGGDSVHTVLKYMARFSR